MDEWDKWPERQRIDERPKVAINTNCGVVLFMPLHSVGWKRKALILNHSQTNTCIIHTRHGPAQALELLSTRWL
jgi:hypothetical protein